MKRWRFWVLLGITLAYAGWLGYAWYQHRIVSHEARFSVVTKVENGIIYGNAAFGVNGSYENETALNPIEVRVTVAPGAAITKTVYYLPSMEELQANGWHYNTGNLRTEIVSGSYADLTDTRKHISGMTVHSEDNIWKKASFTANAISYEEQIWPF